MADIYLSQQDEGISFFFERIEVKFCTYYNLKPQEKQIEVHQQLKNV